MKAPTAPSARQPSKCAFSTCLTANAVLDELENTFPGHSSRITTRISQVLSAPFRFRECTSSVIGNHPIGGTTNLIPVDI